MPVYKITILLCLALVAAGCGRQKAEEPVTPSAPTEEAEVQPEAAPPAPAMEEAEAKDMEPEKEEIAKSFEEILLEILDLERDAKFNEAFQICRSALQKFRDPAQSEILRQAMQRLISEKDMAVELSIAADGLGSETVSTVLVASQKLKEGGETGRILLRKAVREGSEKQVAEAGPILIELRDKYVPYLFVERLRTNPPGPVIMALVKTLNDMNRQLDYSLITDLCDLASQEGPNRVVLVNLILDSLEQSVTLAPAAPPPDGAPPPQIPPALDKLPARLGSLESRVVALLIKFVEQQAAPRAADAPAPSAEETAALARAEKMLVQARFPSVPPTLVQKLIGDPAVPVRDAIVKLLKQMTARLDADNLTQLSAYTAKGGANQLAAVSLVMDTLEGSVTPPPPANAPTQQMQPVLNKIPARLDGALQSAVVDALVAFVKKQSAPRATDAPAPSAEETAALARAERMLVQARFPSVPPTLVKKLTGDPTVPVRDAIVKLLKQMTARLDADDLAQLSAYATKSGANQLAAVSLVMDTLEGSVTPPPPADAPTQQMQPVLNKIPARLDGALQSAVVDALVAFVEKQSAPRAADAPAPSAEETAALARAERMLVQAGFPALPDLLVRKLVSDPASAGTAQTVKLLKQMSDRMDKGEVLQLSNLAAGAGPNKSLFADLVIHVLSKSQQEPGK